MDASVPTPSPAKTPESSPSLSMGASGAFFPQFPTRFVIDTEKNLQYIVSTNGTHTTIECMDKKQFYKWGYDISGDIEQSTNDNMKIKLTPKSVYKILNDFNNNTLNNLITVMMPESYTDQDKPLVIEIKMKAMFDESEVDTKFLPLHPIQQKEHDRLNKKLEVLDMLIAKADMTIQSQKEFIQTQLADYYTREDIDAMDYIVNDDLEECKSETRTAWADYQNKIKTALTELTEAIKKQYSTKAEVTESEKKFYTKAEVDAAVAKARHECYSKAEVDKLLDHFKAEMNAKIAACYTKTEAEAKFTAK